MQYWPGTGTEQLNYNTVIGYSDSDIPFAFVFTLQHFFKHIKLFTHASILWLVRNLVVCAFMDASYWLMHKCNFQWRNSTPRYVAIIIDSTCLLTTYEPGDTYILIILDSMVVQLWWYSSFAFSQLKGLGSKPELGLLSRCNFACSLCGLVPCSPVSFHLLKTCWCMDWWF